MAIGTAIEITDKMTGPLNRITAALYTTTDALNRADRASDSAFSSAGIQAVAQELYGYETRIQEIQNELDRANGKIEEMQEQTRNAQNAADKLRGIYQKAAAVLGTFATAQTIGKVLEASDELTATTARLNMMNNSFKEINGGLETTDQLVQMVYASAQDARGTFSDMAAVVAKFGNNARDAFSSSAEVVDFTNLVQKEMVIAGASTTEASNAMLQLSQALGSGVLRGDELNSIFEQAPNLIQNIADYLDVPIGQIREMASEGQLSADVVKKAVFAASDDINVKFNDMPKTWSQVWTSMQNQALMAFQGVLQKANDIANSDGFESFTESAINGLALIADGAVNVMDLLMQGAGFVADNWSVIEPIVLGVAVALGIYTGALVAYNTAQAIANGLKAAATFQESVHAAATAMEAGATFQATVAQYGFNAALLACPLTWIVLAIIAVIAAIYLVVAAINKVEGTTYSATGVICGILLSAGAFIGNLFVGVINEIITYGVNFWNMLQNFAAAFGIIFNDPIAAIEVMFLSLFDFIVGVVQGAAKMLDAVFGSNLADAVGGFQDKVQAKIDAKIEDAGGKKANTLKKEDYTYDRFSYSGAYAKGYDWGKGVEDKLSSVFSGKQNTPDYGDLLSQAGYDSNYDNLASTLGDISKDTSAIADSVDISNENLQYMRDLAERDTINRFTTATVEVNLGGVQNNVSQNTDLDGVISYLTNGVRDGLEQAAEGVHY